MFGNFLGFDTTTGNAFGIFAGTAVNDTSSVTATAATWDSMWNLGSATLDKAVTVKLTRTLAIIPITLFLAFLRTEKRKRKIRPKGKSKPETNIPVLYSLFYCRIHYHHGGSPGRRAG